MKIGMSALATAIIVLALMSGCGGGQTSSTRAETASDSLNDEPAPDSIADARTAYKIAFVSDRDGNDEIYTAEADGGNVQRLTFTSFSEYSRDWSSDGSKISYMLHTVSLYEEGVDEELYKELGKELIEEWMRENPGITLTDQRIEEIVEESMLEEMGVRQLIYTASADGSNQKPIRDEPVGADVWPAFSPSGQEVVFSSNRRGLTGTSTPSALTAQTPDSLRSAKPPTPDQTSRRTAGESRTCRNAMGTADISAGYANGAREKANVGGCEQQAAGILPQWERDCVSFHFWNDGSRLHK